MKIHPREIYDLLLDSSCSDTTVQEIMIGLTWTFCQSLSAPDLSAPDLSAPDLSAPVPSSPIQSSPIQSTSASGIGLCMSPGQPTRTLPWSGTLVGQSIANLAPWIRAWDSYQAAIGMAVINSVINRTSPLLSQAQPLSPQGSANLAVFEYFLPLIQGQRVVIIGRYPGLAQYETVADLTVLERQPTAQDLPDTACEYLLPTADWVFLTATSIANKTFPRLVELAQSAELVLMGPTVPWLPGLADMGINYLAGVSIIDPQVLRQTIAEGGGTRIFDTAVQYRILKL